jgi:hypothetical protein
MVLSQEASIGRKHDAEFGVVPLLTLLFIRLLITPLVVDIETHHLRGIDHSYQGLSFFEGKLDLRRLHGLVHHFYSSPILATPRDKGFAYNQDNHGIEGCNTSKGKDIDIHEHAPSSWTGGHLILIPMRDLGAVP